MDKLKPNVTLHPEMEETNNALKKYGAFSRIFEYLEHRNNLYVLARKTADGQSVEIISSAFIESDKVEQANKASIKVLYKKGLISFPFVEFEINE